MARSRTSLKRAAAHGRPVNESTAMPTAAQSANPSTARSSRPGVTPEVSIARSSRSRDRRFIASRTPRYSTAGSSEGSAITVRSAEQQRQDAPRQAADRGIGEQRAQPRDEEDREHDDEARRGRATRLPAPRSGRGEGRCSRRHAPSLRPRPAHRAAPIPARSPPQLDGFAFP